MAVPGCDIGRASPSLDVEQFRRWGMSDRAVVSAAIEAWKRFGGALTFEPGRVYDLGSIDPPNPIFRLEGVNGGVLDGRGATLRCYTSREGKTQMFLLRQSRNIVFRNFKATDSGAELELDWRGMDFIHADGSAGGQGPFTIEDVTVQGACSFFTASGLKGDERVRGITIRRGRAERCYYGINLQENGDDLLADLDARNCRRVYYAYGVARHSVRLDIRHNGFGPAATACILLVRALRDTRKIHVRARFSDFLPWTALVRFDQKPPFARGALIEDVTVEIDVDKAAIAWASPVAFAFSASNGRASPARNPGALRNIRILGRLGPLETRAFQVESVPASATGVIFTDLARGESRAIAFR